MKKTVFLALIVALMVFSACGGSGGGTGTTIALDEVVHSYGNEGQEVEMTGYLRPGTFSMVRNNIVHVGLYTEPSRGKELSKVSMGFGRQAKRMYMPEKFSESDIEIYDNDNQKHDYKTKFTVKGVLKYTKKDWRNDLEVGELAPAVANNATLKKTRVDAAERAKKAMEKRTEEQNGDPNDYSFEIQLKSLTVADAVAE